MVSCIDLMGSCIAKSLICSALLLVILMNSFYLMMG